jgi:hypothetical protein
MQGVERGEWSCRTTAKKQDSFNMFPLWVHKNVMIYSRISPCLQSIIVLWVISKLLYIQPFWRFFFKEVNAGNVFRKGLTLLKWKLKLKIPWNKEKSNQIFRGQCEASV